MQLARSQIGGHQVASMLVASAFGPSRLAPCGLQCKFMQPSRPAATGIPSGLDRREGSQLTSLGFLPDASHLAISSDGRYALTQGHTGSQHEHDDSDTRIWDLKARGVIWQGNMKGFVALSVAVDYAAGRYVFCKNRTLMVWPMDEELQLPFSIDAKDHGIAGEHCMVAVSAGGRYALSSGNSEVKVWDLERRRCLGSAFDRGEGKPQGVCLSPDERYAAVTRVKPDRLQLVDFHPGSRSSIIAHLPGRYDWTSFTITADRRYAVSTAADARKGLQLWELHYFYARRPRPIATLHGLVGPVTAVAVQPNERIVTITQDTGDGHELHVWDARPWWQRILGRLDISY